MKAIECPRCKGSTKLESVTVDQEIYVCEYCGAEIRSRVKSSEAMRARIRVKELEHEEAMLDKQCSHEINVMNKAYEQEADKDEREERERLSGILIMCVIAIVLIGAMAFSSNNPGFELDFNQAQIPKSASQIQGTNHEIIEKELKNLGFTNIESQGLGDKGGWFDFATEGDIVYISINGNSTFDRNTWFNKDSAVIIKYHSYPDQQSTDNIA